MSIGTIFNFTVDRERLTVIVERSFEAPVDLVWAAWTEADILDQWWGPQPYRAETKSMSFTEGGHWLYAMVGPNGERHWGIKFYQTINPVTGFTNRSAFCDEDGNLAPGTTGSTWVNTFTEKDGITLVTNHIHVDTLEHLELHLTMGFKEGYTVCLDQLETLLASHANNS